MSLAKTQSNSTKKHNFRYVTTETQKWSTWYSTRRLQPLAETTHIDCGVSVHLSQAKDNITTAIWPRKIYKFVLNQLVGCVVSSFTIQNICQQQTIATVSFLFGPQVTGFKITEACVCTACNYWEQLWEQRISIAIKLATKPNLPAAHTSAPQ